MKISIDKSLDVPVYRQIKEQIRAGIVAGDITGHIHSERRLAEDCGICHMTARRAICELVDEGLLERHAGRRGTFVRDADGRGVATRTIGVVSCFAQDGEFANFFSSRIFSGVQKTLEASDYHISIANTLESFFEAGGCKGNCPGRPRVDGLIFLPGPPVHGMREAAVLVPTVMVCKHPGGAPRVLVDDYQGARDAVAYLLELGHTRIAHVAGFHRASTAQGRRRGYEDALRRSGAEIPEGYIIEGCYSFDSGCEAAGKILRLAPRPTAVFCASDEQAAGLLHGISEAGLSVPEDISIVGFEDNDLARQVYPPLTTVHVPMGRLGERAAGILLKWIESGKRPEESSVTLAVELVRRKSCRQFSGSGQVVEAF